MTLRKVASKFSIASNAYTEPVTRSRSKGIIQEQDQGSVIAQSILKQLMESPKGEIIIRENHLFDHSTSASNLSKQESDLVVSFMMTDVTIEAAMAKMERKINFLMKAVKERYHEISASRDQMKVCETTESSKTLATKANDKGKVVL